MSDPKCDFCKCPITNEQVARCKEKFKHLDYYRNKIFCERHLYMVLDELRERREEKRLGIKRLKPWRIWVNR